MAAVPHLTPLRSAANDHGIQYELKMAALMALRAQQLPGDFQLFRNVAPALPFDDVVVRLSTGSDSVLALVQLKHGDKRRGMVQDEGQEMVKRKYGSTAEHRTKGKTLDVQAFAPKQKEGMKPKGDFNLRKYFAVFERLYAIYQKPEDQLSEDEMFFRGTPLDNVYFLLYTNKAFGAVSGEQGVSHLQRLEQLICTNSNVSSFSFNQSHKMVWDLFGDDARGQLFRERFLPRLRVFHHQVHVTDLDDLILQEILKILGKPLPQLVANQVLLYFLQEIKSWADKNNGECIWRHSRLLELAVGSELRRQAMATTGRLKFIDEHCSSLLRKLKQTLRGLPPRSLQVSVQGVPAGLRASKLLQVLDGSDEFRYKWVYFNDTVLQTFSIAFLITVCNTCQVIVLDTDISSNRLIFQEEMSQVRHEKCVVTLKSLENGEFTDNWTLNELDEENQVLHLNRAINFQGKRIPLKDLESSWESMRQDIDGEFLAILEKQEPKMGGDILPLKEHVLPRHLAHRHVVSAKTLVEKEAVGGDERLALEGFPQSLLEQVARHLGFLDDERDEKLSSVLLKNNDRWTVMNYEDEPSRKDVNQFLESLAREKKAPAIHCLVYVSGRSLEEVCMIWRNSFGTTDVIQNRIIPLTRDCNVKEPLCIHRSTTSLRSLKRALLVGAAGHGKTTYFSSLASELKEEDPTHWVVKLKILQHTNLLRKWRNVKELTVDHVIEVLATAAGAETGSTRRFLEAALRHSGAVSILVDGVDEIAPFFKEVTLRLLHLIMNETRVRRLWISTRPEVEQSLRRLLKSPPLALQSLTEEEQCQILSTLLTSSISGRKEIRAKEIVHLVNKKVDELLATPLHLKMLAEVLSSKDNQSLDVRKLTLLNLYKNFVSIKLREFEERYNAENLTHDDVDEKHEKCSIVYLFADDPFAGELPVEEFKEFIMKNNSLLKATEKSGIVWLNEKKTISFVHQTFAEFFAAKWFWKNARESAGARTYVLQMNEWSDKNRFQSFLNDMLAEDWPFHAAAWRKDMREVERLVENGLGVENWDMRDALLDWTFGQYVEWAYQEHIDVYFPKRNSLDAWLIIALKAAVVSGCAKIVSEIASRVVLSSAILNRLLHEAAKCQGNAQVDVTRILLQHGAKDSVGPSGWSALHWSVENRNSAMMELLLSMSHDQDVNQRNYLGQTPLHLALRGWTFNHWHEGAQRLIQKKTIDVNVKDRVGESPLMYACFSNCVSCVGALLNRKAHIDGQTLAKVTRNGSDNALRSILENEAHLDPLHEDVSTALHLAAFYGHKDILQLLLCHGAKVNASDSKGETALHIGTLSTALEGSTELLQLLLSYGADVNTTDSQGCTVLHYAAKEGHKVAVELFLSRGGLVNATDSCGQTPLHVAASHKHKEVVQSLLSRGAKFDVTNVDGCTALHIAASHGHNETVRLLLDECGDPGVEFSSVYSAMEVAMNRNEWETAKIVLEHICRSGMSDDESNCGNVKIRALHFATQRGWPEGVMEILQRSTFHPSVLGEALHFAAIGDKSDHIVILQLLLENGAQDITQDKRKRTVLHRMIERRNLPMLELLLRHKRINNKRDDSGGTPLHCAIGESQLQHWHQGVQRLIQNEEVDVNTEDRRGRTPLALVSKVECTGCLESLLHRGAQVTSEDTFALFSAALRNNHMTILRLLFENGFQSNAVNEDGSTALHIAALHGNLEALLLLLDWGADLSLRNSYGDTALDSAVKRSQWKAGKRLVKHSPTDVTVRCLIQAAEANNVDVLKFLLNEGIDSNATDEESNTPLHAAAKKGHTELVELLLEKGGEKSVKNKEGKTPLQLAMQNLHFKCAKILWH